MRPCRWIGGLLFPRSHSSDVEIPPPPVKNPTDPSEDPALDEMDASLSDLDLRSRRLRSEWGALRRE